MTATVLRAAGRTVGRYVHHPELPGRLAPRPYLHPLTTLAGVPVTEFMPGDHLHHLGVSVAVPDVDGRNFWGGRTYVRDRGPAELDDHGVQEHLGLLRGGPDGFTEELSWRTGDRELLRERRTVTARALGEGCWALDVTFALANPGDRELTLGSPATNGRPGAGYGGFFWRAPAEPERARVFTAGAEGEEAVHGRAADWLALSGEGWTLVFAGATAGTRRDPWFVRTAEYPGVGSSLAWARRLPVPAGGTVTRRIVTAVADGSLGPAQAGALARRLVEGSG
ncbi:PmoA family protein [Streptomyces sp. NPDC059718]